MPKTRYELLQPTIANSDRVIAAAISDFIGLCNYPRDQNARWVRRWDTFSTLCAVVLRHLGYEVPVDLEKRVNDAFDVVLDYFLGDWWKADPDRAYLDKASPELDGRWWSEVFEWGMFLGPLTGRWSDVSRLCEWIDDGLVEHCDHELIISHMYMSMASHLRPEPLPGMARIEARLNKVRDKSTKLRYLAWLAARNGDQAAFDKAITESLNQFEKKYHSSPNKPVPGWIAFDESVILLVAMHLGLRFPSNLGERLAAMVVTRDSLGFEPN